MNNKRRISWIQPHCSPNECIMLKHLCGDFISYVTEIKVEILNAKGQNLDEILASGGNHSASVLHEYYTVYLNGSDNFSSMYPIGTVNVGFEDVPGFED